MAMTLGNGPRADINMTPMIDVLLVLIIIFMVITPLKPVGLNALVPQVSTSGAAASTGDELVVEVCADGTLRLNSKSMDLVDLRRALRGVVAPGASRVVFVHGEHGIEFQRVAEVIDLAHEVGIDRVALMPR